MRDRRARRRRQLLPTTVTFLETSLLCKSEKLHLCGVAQRQGRRRIALPHQDSTHMRCIRAPPCPPDIGLALYRSSRLGGASRLGANCWGSSTATWNAVETVCHPERQEFLAKILVGY